LSRLQILKSSYSGFLVAALWISPSKSLKAKSVMRRLHVSSQTLKTLDALIGTIFCAVLAALSVILFPRNGHHTALPLLFVVVIGLVATRYGALAGVLGSISAAMIFSYFWFLPIGSFSVTREAARSNLSWMLILGITVSYFLSFPARVKDETTKMRASSDSVPASDRRAA
jgi:K+-sensing histidine kinase KdpD